MKHAFVVLLILVASSVSAEVDRSERRASNTQSPGLFDDAEHFAVHGPIADRVATRDTDKFERDITRAGVMVHYASPHEFIAVGGSREVFRQGEFSAGVDAVILAGRKTNRRTAEGVTGRLAVTTNTEKKQWYGEGTWNFRLAEQTGVELVGSRDGVETVAALQQGVMSTFLGASVSHEFTDRFTAIAMPTYQKFNDGNAHKGWRGWLIYNLIPDWGIGVELKRQGYESTGDSKGLYFSPDNYERNEAGLRFRRGIGGWRVIASAAAGQERINREIEKPTRTFLLTTQKTFENDVTVGIQFSYFRASNSGTDLTSSDQYAWRMGRVFAAIPF